MNIPKYHDYRDSVMDQMQSLVKALDEREERRNSGLDTSAYQLGYLISTMATVIAKIPVKHQKFIIKEVADMADWVKSQA